MDAERFFKESNNDPDFAKLTYEQQVQARNIAFKELYKQDTELQGMSDNGIAAVYKGLVYGPPALLNKDNQAGVKQLVADKAAGNGGDYEFVKSGLVYARDSGLLMTLGTRSGIAIGGAVSNLIGAKDRTSQYFTADEDERRLSDFFKIQEAAGFDEGNTLRGILQFGGNVADFVVGTKGVGAAAAGIKAAATGAKYAGGALSAIQESRTAMQAAQQALNVAKTSEATAIAAESLNAAKVGYNAARSSLLTNTSLSSLIQATPKFQAMYAASKTMMATRAITAFADVLEGAAVGLTYGTLSDIATHAINREMDTSSVASIGKFAETFGLNTAMDIGVNLALKQIAAPIASVLKNVYGKRVAGIDLKALTDREFTKFKDEFMAGKTVDPSGIHGISAYHAANIQQANDIAALQQAKKTPAQMNDYEKLITVSNVIDPTMAITKNADNSFNVFNLLTDKSGKISVLKANPKTFFDLTDLVANSLQKKSAKEALRLAGGTAILKQYAPWVENWVATGKQAGDIIDFNNTTKSSRYINANDRPYVGMNEIDGPGKVGVMYTKVNMPNIHENISDALSKGEHFVSYDVLHNPLLADVSPNAVVLSSKIKNLSVDEYNGDLHGSVLTARSQGFDTIRLTDSLGNDAGIVPLNPKNVKAVFPEVDRHGHVATSGADLHTADKIKASSMISYNLDKKLSLREANLNPDLVTSHGLKTFVGAVDESEVKRFMQLATGRDDIPIIVTKADISSANIETMNSLSIKDNQIHVTVPASIGNARDSIALLRSLTNKLGMLKDHPMFNHINGIGRLGDTMKKFGANADESHPFFKMLTGEGIYNKYLMQNILGDNFKATLKELGNGRYEVSLNGRIIQGNLAEIYRTIRPSLIPVSYIRKSVANLGYKLTATKDGRFIVKSATEKLQFNSLEEAMNNLGIDTNVMPAKYRPRFIEISNDGQVHVSADGMTISLNNKDTYKFLNSFDDGSLPERVEIIKNQNGYAALINNIDEIKIVDNYTKSKMNFSSFEEAKAFYKDFNMHSIETIAKSKGLTIEVEKGSYVIRDGSGTEAKFANRNDAITYMRENYRTDNFDATESLGGFEELSKQIPADILKEWKKFNNVFSRQVLEELDTLHDFTPAKSTDIAQNFVNLMSTFKTAFGRLLKNGQVHGAMEGYVNRAIKASEAFNAEVHSARKLVLTIFTGKQVGGRWTIDATGKTMKRARREIVLKHLDQSGDPESLAKLREDVPLIPGEEEVIKNIQDMFGRRTDRGLTGLANRFGIPYYKFRDSYISHVRKVAFTNKEVQNIINSGATPTEIFDKLEAGKFFAPGSLRETRLWFEHSRSSEFRDALYDTDAMSVLLRYTEAGLKKVHTDIPNQQLKLLLNSPQKLGSPEAYNLLNRFYDVLTGGNRETAATQAWANLGQGLYKKFGQVMATLAGKDRNFLGHNADYWTAPEFELRGRNIVNNVMNLSYANLLGFRPMAAFRNAISVFSTYGPAFGQSYLLKGGKWLDEATKGQREALVEKLLRNDILQATHKRLDIEQAQGMIGHLTDKAMTMFKNADDYTRSIAFMASSHRFMESVAKLHKGDFGSDFSSPQTRNLFESYSKLSAFAKTDPAFTSKIWEKISNPSLAGFVDKVDLRNLNFGHADFDIANTAFAQRSIEQTLFNYSPWNKPMLFNSGMVGKLFGQLGTFSAGYRNMISNLWTNLPAGERLAFVGSFIATNLALYTAFTAAGMKANDFIPFVPGVAGTGPFYDSMEDFISILTADGRQIPTAAKRLMENYTPFKIAEVPQYSEASGLTYTRKELQLHFPTMLPGGLMQIYIDKAFKSLEKHDIRGALISLSGASTLAEGSYDVQTKGLTDPVQALQATVQSGLRTLQSGAAAQQQNYHLPTGP